MRKQTILTAMALCLAFTTPAKAAEYNIKMVSDAVKGTYYFEPSQLTIKSGDTVTWINAQDDMHEVMTESVPEKAQPFESPMLEKKGQQWSHVFTTAGTYQYHCHPHEVLGMRGVILVGVPSKADLSTPIKPSPLTEQQAVERLQQSKPVYSCGMKPTWFSPEPGQCPCCTMQLGKVKEVRDGKAVFESGQDMKMDMKDMPMDMKGMSDKDMQKMMEKK